MTVKDALGTRMKENYENVAKSKLVRRMPVAIRIDGKAFHTFTKGFNKPFDKVLMRAMQRTTAYLCKNIQGCVFGYTQSDEISLILIDYKKLNSSAWFDYQVQKMCSVAASMATMAFNKYFEEEVSSWWREYSLDPEEFEKMSSLEKVYSNAIYKGALFDARCFNIPKEEVGNLIYWRQLDAMRNSINMVAQSVFSHKSLQGLSCNDMLNKLLEEKGINWNDLPTECKHGTAVYYENGNWIIDRDMPILKENWDYINKHIYVGED